MSTIAIRSFGAATAICGLGSLGIVWGAFALSPSVFLWCQWLPLGPGYAAAALVHGPYVQLHEPRPWLVEDQVRGTRRAAGV